MLLTELYRDMIVSFPFNLTKLMSIVGLEGSKRL